MGYEQFSNRKIKFMYLDEVSVHIEFSSFHDEAYSALSFYLTNIGILVDFSKRSLLQLWHLFQSALECLGWRLGLVSIKAENHI